MHEGQRVLVTGAGGFLGKELLEKLLKDGDNRFELLVAMTSQPEKLAQKYSGYKSLRIVDSRDLSCFSFSEVDVLIHCAFPRNEEGVELARGLTFTRDVLSKASWDGVGSVINISSQMVYSQKRLEPATEETEINLETKYAVGKYAAELMTDEIFMEIPHTSLRMASLIGVGFHDRLVNKFVRQALEREPICINSGKQRFEFMDVRDAATAILNILDFPLDRLEPIYNLGSGDVRTLEEIAHLVSAIGSEYLDWEVPIHETEGERWHNSSLNSEQFRRDFLWKPAFTLEDTIKYLFEDVVSCQPI